MNILVLDDDKSRQQSFKKKIPDSKVVNTTAEFVAAVKGQDVWNIVFLGTGLQDTISWIKENEPQIRNIIIHNHDGVAGMEAVQVLKQSKYTASYLPYSVMMSNLEKIHG